MYACCRKVSFEWIMLDRCLIMQFLARRTVFKIPGLQKCDNICQNVRSVHAQGHEYLSNGQTMNFFGQKCASHCKTFPNIMKHFVILLTLISLWMMPAPLQAITVSTTWQKQKWEKWKRQKGFNRNERWKISQISPNMWPTCLKKSLASCSSRTPFSVMKSKRSLQGSGRSITMMKLSWRSK